MSATSEDRLMPRETSVARLSRRNPGLLVILVGLAFGIGFFADHLLMRRQAKQLREKDIVYFTEQLRLQASEVKRNQDALEILGVGGVQGLKVQGVSFQTEPVSAWMFDPKLHDAHVAEVAKIPSIKKLELGSTSLTIQCLQYIDQLSNLEHLRLSGAWIKDGAAEMIRDNNSLKKLHLQEVSLSDEHIGALLMRFPNLQELTLTHNTSAGAQTIMAIAKLKNLRTLIVSSTTLRDDDCVPLSALSSLEVLGIVECSLSDAALAQIGRIESLTELDLSDNPISNEGLKHLAQLKKLQRLRVLRTSVTGANGLATELPDCKIETQDFGLPPIGGESPEDGVLPLSGR